MTRMDDGFNNVENTTIIFLVNAFTLILGLVLGMVLGYFMFKGYIYKGPDSNVVINQIHTEPDGKKYKWVPKVCICPITYSMDKLKNPNYIDPEH